MDQFLRDKGNNHIIFISPTKKQLMKQEAIDTIINNLMHTYQLNAYYIAEEIDNTINLTDTERNDCYHDSVHLSEFGHKIWGNAISYRLKEVLRTKFEKSN